MQHDLTQLPLNRSIILLAIPMVLEMAMESLFAVCDIFFVGRLGEDAVAAVGLTESMLTILYAIAIGLAMATTATVARRVGEKNLAGAARAGAQSIYVGLGVAMVIGVAGGLMAPRLLGLMGAEDSVIAIGGGYATVLYGSNAVILLLFLHNAIFRGAGDAAIAMRALWLANGINIALDPCLIFGLGPFPEMGLTGAAVATTCGRGAGVLFQIRALRRGHGRIHLKGSAWTIDFAAMAQLMRVSAGGIAQFLVATASWVALMRIMSQFGSVALAGYTIAIRVIVFAILPSWGLSNAAATLVGQNLGAGQPDRAERAVWRTGWFNMTFLGSIAVLFIAAADPIISVFTDEPAVRAIGIDTLVVISCGYLAYAWGMVMIQSFNGAGDTMTPTWINLFCFWLVQIPLAWGLANGAKMGPSGVMWAVAVSESLLAGVAIVWFRRGHWKTRQV